MLLPRDCHGLNPQDFPHSTSELLHYAVLKHKQCGWESWSRSAAMYLSVGAEMVAAGSRACLSACGGDTLSPVAPTSLSKVRGSWSRSRICPFLPFAACQGLAWSVPGRVRADSCPAGSDLPVVCWH